METSLIRSLNLVRWELGNLGLQSHEGFSWFLSPVSEAVLLPFVLELSGLLEVKWVVINQILLLWLFFIIIALFFLSIFGFGYLSFDSVHLACGSVCLVISTFSPLGLGLSLPLSVSRGVWSVFTFLGLSGRFSFWLFSFNAILNLGLGRCWPFPVFRSRLGAFSLLLLRSWASCSIW